MSSSDQDNGTYQIITLLPLTARVGGADQGIDETLSDRADTAVLNLQGVFLQCVATAVGEITVQSTLAEKLAGDNEEYVAEITRVFGDLQMQATAFGFPLAGNICASLCRYVETLDSSDDLAEQVVRAHATALRSVVDNTIDGDGGETGHDLIKSLDDLISRSHA